VRPAALLQVLQRQAHVVTALDDGRVDDEGLVVRRRLLAPDEEVLALGLRGLAESLQVLPGLRDGEAVVLEDLVGVPDAVDRHHVVQGDELAVEGTGILDAAVERVADLGALEVVRVQDVVERLELVQDRVPADLVGARVVDQVRRVAADEARLQLLRDLGGGGDLDRGPGLALLHDLRRALDVVHAVAAVEDHRVDLGVRGHAERVVGRLRAAGGTAAATAARSRAGRQADAEGHHDRGERRTAQQRAAADGSVFGFHVIVAFLSEG
jgi:hypothetical protein